MTFLNSIWLWGGLAAAGISVPVIIHLLNRFKHRRTQWAAMELLRKALVVRSRQIRLEDLLLLLLRCLALLLLAFAMARPTLTGLAAAKLGGPQQVGAVIALDISYSMDHTAAQSRFARAKQRIGEITGMLKPGDRVTLVLMGAEPRIIRPAGSFDARQFASELDKIKVVPEALDPAANLAALEEVVAELKTPVRECYILTDAQIGDWTELAPQARQSLQNITEAAKLFMVPVAGASWENLAITAFEPALRQGRLARYVADVHNFGRRAVDDATVTLTVGDRPAERRPVGRVEPGRTVSVPLLVNLDSSGAVPLSVELTRDALATDNARHAVAYVRSVTRVLVVDGQPSGEPFASETDFIVRALQPRPQAADAGGEALQVRRIDWTRFADEILADYDVIMLANLVDLLPLQVQQLSDWVRQGGGLVVFVGNNVEPTIYNNRLRTDAGPLLPAELGPTVAVTEEEAGWVLEPALREHRLARVLEVLPDELVAATPLRKRMTLELHPYARPIWRTAADNEAVLAEHRFGRGQVLLFAHTADRAWTDLPITPLFLMTLHETVSELTRPLYEQPIAVAEPALVPLPRLPLDSDVIVTQPDGQVTTFAATQSIQSLADLGYPASVELSPVDQPGLWTLNTGEGLPTLVLAANVNAREAATQPIPTEQLVETLGVERLIVVDDAASVASAVTGSRIGQQLWTYALIAALVVFILEALLARWFSRRIEIRARETETRWTRAATPA